MLKQLPSASKHCRCGSQRTLVAPRAVGKFQFQKDLVALEVTTRTRKKKNPAPSKAKQVPGDVVVGEVVSTGPLGSKVQLQQGMTGFLPHNQDPLHLEGDMYVAGAHSSPAHKPAHQHNGSAPGLHLVREFQVLPYDADKGPLLSAMHHDYAVLYKRAQQIAELCAEGQVLSARVIVRNAGGVRVCCLGVTGFIPISYLPRKYRDLFNRGCDEGLIGAELPVVIEEVVPEKRRVLLNSVAAVAAKRTALQPATLVHGVVQQVHPSYVWVELSGLDQDGHWAWLHRNDTSVDKNFSGMQAVFEVGEPITAMVLRCEEDGERLTLSTAHLEVVAGDMLRDKQAVYATAGQQVELVRQQMAQQAAQASPEAAAAVAPHEADVASVVPLALTAMLDGAEQQQVQDEHVPSNQSRQSAQKPATKPAAPSFVPAADAFAPLSGYISGAGGRALGVVMAAAVWQGSDADDWSDAGGGEGAMASMDTEQSWWATGPLAWRTADEREQWQAEQQLVQQHTVQATQDAAGAASGAAREDGLALVADGVDGEQQWLQPPAAHWEQPP